MTTDVSPVFQIIASLVYEYTWTDTQWPKLHLLRSDQVPISYGANDREASLGWLHFTSTLTGFKMLTYHIHWLDARVFFSENICHV